MFENKTIVLGVSGGIAAYKAAQLASDFSKTAAEVHVIMTKNAAQFIAPITFETLTNHRVSIDTFDRNFEYNVEHVSLAKKADVFLVAPATANVIAKMAAGIADDMLTTTVLAASCQKIVAPAMNTGMYDNPITQRNLQILKDYGVQIIEPASGWLACGDVGRGRMPNPEVLFEAVRRALSPKDLKGLHVLVTAGPTQEAIDPVRFVSNHSSGKMGYEIAAAAVRRGAQVTLVTGKTALTPPVGVHVVPVVSAQEMFDAVTSRASEQDIIVKCAAVADYKPQTSAEDKIKKHEGNLVLQMSRTKDILAYLGSHQRSNQVLCGFSMETKDLLENSRAKLDKKGADMIVANSLKEAGAGFGTDTNRVTLLTREQSEPLPLMGKDAVADALIDRLVMLYQSKQ